MKKSLFILPFCGALLLSGNANALWESNWLAGVYGGLAEREGSVDLIASHPAGLFTSYIQEIEDIGVVGGLLGGYQVRCHEWLFGAELNIEWQEVSHDRDAAFTNALGQGVNITTSYAQRNIVGFSGRFGYEMFPNFLPYVRLGVQSSRDKMIVRATTPDFEDSADMEDLRRVYRLTAGVGAEFPICFLMGLSARAEYNFRARAGSIEAYDLGLDNETVLNASMRPRANTLLLALVFNFV